MTARPLVTPGEVMQLPPTDEIVLVSSLPPIRAKKARYYEDAQLKDRILPAPSMPRSAEEWDFGGGSELQYEKTNDKELSTRARVGEIRRVDH